LCVCVCVLFFGEIFMKNANWLFRVRGLVADRFV